jgi:LysM repeat protein
VAGPLESLLDFLGRIEEVELSGFLISQVSIAPDQAQGSDQAQHLLTMNVSVYTSPYSTRSALAESFENVAQLPLAEVQRQMEQAWLERDWQRAITLLGQVVAATPENEAARIALYRAHVNYGYAFLAERNYAAAKEQFEAALIIQPDGREATVELQQMAADNTLSHSVQDRLRQEVQQASAAGNWQETIRLLRIIDAVDAAYGSVESDLNQAYISYGDQLAAQGDSVRAEELYALADYSPPDREQPAEAAPLAPLTVTATITPQAISLAQATMAARPAPTSTPTPTPSLTPSATTPPTASPTPSLTPTPLPSPTATSTAPQPPAQFQGQPSAPPSVSTPVATSPSIAFFFPPTAVPADMPTATIVDVATVPAQILPPAPTSYIVQPGDTLFSIARRYGTTVEALKAANGLYSDDIRAGQSLYMGPYAPQPPSSGYTIHTVVHDDTLYSLSRRYGTTVEAIMQANGLRNDRIYVGQRLTIPGVAVAPVLPVLPTATIQLPIAGCDPNYAGACIPIQSEDLDCGIEIGHAVNFLVVGNDPHELDGNSNDIACEQDELP